MENENPIVGSDEQKKLNAAKKLATRPAMQIYRPPGLRSGGASSPPSDSPPENGDVDLMQRGNPGETAGQKPSTTRPTRPEENNNHRKSPPRAKTEERLNRTESSLSTESAVSQKSSGAGSHHEVEKQKPAEKAPRPRQQQHRPAQPKEKPRKIMGPKEIGEAADALRALHIPNNVAELEQLVASEFRDEGAAECVGNAIVQHAIEGGTNCCKQSTKACGLLVDSPCFPGLSRGLYASVAQYFDCRERLRQEHFRMWISFLNFVSDIYANIGNAQSGELVNVVFQVFDYLLRAPVLETLKIEELECLIASLLSIGWGLERDCPDRLSQLKDLIRDAFIDVHEPWARKMILLLLELGASGWKLPPDANEYYFLQGNN